MRPAALLVSLALCVVLSASLVSARLPAGFHFGAATAAYQIEGSWNVDGKQPNEWDFWSRIKGKVANGDTGDVADDGYVRAIDDISFLTDMGLNAYRFSISWGRIIDADGNVNPKGVAHYNQLIDALLAAGITPYVTLYHWDLPLEYSTITDLRRGFLNATYIVPLYERYADACFAAFGDRVKNWIIFNEPHSFCVGGFATGRLAPGRCSDRSFCDQGDSDTEPYLCAHSVILAYAAAANLWRSKYEPQFGKGSLSISLDSSHAEPYTQSQADIDAAERSMIWNLAWWADPLFKEDHDYPAVMRELVGDRLPVLTAENKAALATATPDIFGHNHYTTIYSFNDPNSTVPFTRDQQSGSTYISAAGVPIGPQAASSWLYVVPWGFPKTLQWIKNRYNVPIQVTENGVDIPGESSLPLPDVLNDQFRVDYLEQYASNMTEVAIAQLGVDIRAYFVWSLMDNFEWADGYNCRFGLTYIDYTNGCKRYPKSSSAWYANWIKEQKATDDAADQLNMQTEPLSEAQE